MTPTGRPKGRPRKIDSLSSTATTTRASSSRRSTGKLANKSSTTSQKHKPAAPSSVNDEGDDDDEISSSYFASPSGLHKYVGPKVTKRVPAEEARDSLSSVSTVNDYNESSGYSTPLTSGVATPATSTKPTTSTTRRRPGRPRATMSHTATPSINIVARAAALRNSQLSLNPNKRKRIPDSEDEEDADEDNTADAQLARALQEREDAKSNSMSVMKFDGPATRRTPRKTQKIMPKINYGSEISDDEDVKVIYKSPGLAKRPKIELSAKGNNGVKFMGKGKGKAKIIQDSDDSDDFIEIDDSEDSDVPIAMTTPRSRMKHVIQEQSKAFKASSSPRQRLTKMMPPATTSRSRSTNVGFKKQPAMKREDTKASTSSGLTNLTSRFPTTESDFDSSDLGSVSLFDSDSDSDVVPVAAAGPSSSIVPRSRPRPRGSARHRINLAEHDTGVTRRSKQERARLEAHHPELQTMWKDLENLPKIGSVKIEQPKNISRELKPFQLEGVAWMKAMEKTDWGGGLLGDEMGMGKTIQAVSLIMSDFPAAQPSLVLIPPVALMQWQQEIAAYTDGTLKTFVYHGTNAHTKGATLDDLRKYHVILMSYNSLESMYRKQEKGFKRKTGLHKEESIIHQIQFHRVILDEAHNIKSRTTGSAKACFALKADHKWCLSGTPLQNRIGEFFSLVRFLDIKPFACYFCKQCPCSTLNWDMNENNRCSGCLHSGMQHVSVFNQELLNPIQKFGNNGPGKEAFRKLRILTDRFMLRRVKRDHSSAMELPAKEIYVNRQFFGEEENDFAGSIMNNGTRKFETYVSQGVLLNNYANIFGLIMQMRQVADHPDLILKKNGEGGQNVLVCCICDETAEEAIRSSCRHEFCRECAKNYLNSSDEPDCPQCHIPLSIDLEQPDIEQDEQMVKKSSIINRIKMENWTSSSKIEALVHDIWQLRSKTRTTKSIIFSQFTTMLQLVEWRLRRAGITTVMLDGSMTPAQRQASINHFMTDVNVECFLVSLKAGGVALNLTEASHVFIVDPWWNPAAEWQSADRCHRIGQARPCSITRLCIEDSVESRMVMLQEKKANMINSTINSDESAMESLTPEDMQFLFRGN
ncbi:DNA repair protein RAD16 [Lachnellula cervina]|uniref:DNA repair protein RAD16 n=1 Tax=Lachnellula cervina TaxID=1316786 RepID=A0A7D8V192_9HELO|nr:DNA repair protein RAD16 [Lachnellula cervina]